MEEQEMDYKKTILIVDDEKMILNLLSCNLIKEGYNVIEAKDGLEAITIAQEEKPDLILLDVMLPKLDGLSVCKRVKNIMNVPILMVTAKDDELDKILGLELGADDYITKPFGVMELLSRIKAVLRRAGKQNAEADVIEEQGVSLDASRRICTYNGQEVVLTYKEFELLMYLMRHKSIAVSRDKLMEMVWGYEFAGETRTVDMHIKTLRQKLEAAGCTDLIKTVRGIGYKI